MFHAPASRRPVALAALLNCACPALNLDPVVTDGTTGTPPDPATTTGEVTDGDGTTTAPATGDTSSGTTDTLTGIMPETSTDSTTTSSTTSGSEETTSTHGTTGPSGCAGDVVDNPACEGVTPYCIDGACVSCTELVCADAEPGKPVCAQDVGICVQCQQQTDCGGDTPICNQATGTCTQCIDHEQCPETACNLETGVCFPGDSILYVDNTPSPPIECSDAKADWGTSPEQPLCTLQNALSRVVEGQPTTIKLKTGSKPQSDVSETNFGDFTIAIRHYGNTIPSLVTSFTDPALTINEGNLVFMHRIGIYNQQPVGDPLIAEPLAVLYGHGEATQSVSIDAHELERLFSHWVMLRSRNLAWPDWPDFLTEWPHTSLPDEVPVDAAVAAATG